METLVRKIKQSIMSSPSSSSVSPSAYDTAWVAMVPHPDHPGRPMFPGCLYWVLRSQRPGGFWGETDHRGLPTLDSLTNTLACLVALITWGTSHPHRIQQGLDFLHSRTEELLATHRDNSGGGGLPRWFAIVFPGMLELAESVGLDVFREGFFGVVKGVFEQRSRILEKDNDEAATHLDLDGHCYFPLESYLEVLPAEYAGVDFTELVATHLDGDGSLFRSPSATAFAFMATGDLRCRAYLETMVAQVSRGAVNSHEVAVPPVYPLDEQLLKLWTVDVFERLGIAEHFVDEIADAMDFIYSNWTRDEAAAQDASSRKVGHGGGGGNNGDNLSLQLYKDAVAFRLLRMHGYRVSPGRLCTFLHDKDIKQHIEKNWGCYLGAILNVYRATHVEFPKEEELEEAKHFSNMLLKKGAIISMNSKDSVVIFTDFQRQVEMELELPWLARMDHLEHRRFIEAVNNCTLWVAKASFYKFLCVNNSDMLQLAVESFTIRQITYRDELEEMKRWSKDLGLSNMGFGREKTAYIYFSTAANLHLPLISEVRKVITKCAILVTVADDFYDMEGEWDELCKLNEAVQRWEGKDLHGLSKVIFDSLHGLVEELGLICINQHGNDLTEVLQNIWRETFASWLKEAEWSRSNHAPPIDEYVKVGMISIAIQAMILPACYLLSLWQPENYIEHHYDEITKYLMILARLLNDVQSHEKEYLDGKMNMVILLKNEGLTRNIDESKACVNHLLEAKKKEFLRLVLMERPNGHGMPKQWKQIHLLCLKAFQMFFNGENIFDSPTALLQRISMAINDPLIVEWSCNPIDDPKKIKLGSKEDESISDWYLSQSEDLLQEDCTTS